METMETILLILTVEEFEQFKLVAFGQIVRFDESGKNHNVIEVYLNPHITINQIWLYSRIITKRLYMQNIHDVKY